MDEARKLVEQSFGNYLGSNVMLASKEELERIQRGIGFLAAEVSDDAIDMKVRKILSESAYREITSLLGELRVYSSSILLFLVSGLFKLDTMYCFWSEVGQRLRLLSAYQPSGFPHPSFSSVSCAFCMNPWPKCENISVFVFRNSLSFQCLYIDLVM